MAREEVLREALLEVTELRRREAEALRESNALLSALAAASSAEGPQEALAGLLASVRETIDCAAAALVTFVGEDAVVECATDPALIGLRAPEGRAYMSRPRRVVDLAALDRSLFPPEARAMICAPLGAEGALPYAALACTCLTPDRFERRDLAMLQRLGQVAAQAVAGQRLARRNALLAAVIDGASSSVAIADARDPGLPLVYVNAAFERLTGYPRDEVLGRNCRFLSAEAEDADVRVRLRDTVARRGSGEFELRNRRRSGTEFLNRLTLYPVAQDGGVATHLVATQIDVTASRAAELERDEARRRLVEALSAIAEGFLLVDEDGRVVLANARYRDFYAGARWAPGVDFRQAWAAHARAGGLSEADAADAAERRLYTLVNGGSDQEEALPDGRVVQVSDRRVAGVGAVCVVADITRLKAAERSLSERAVAVDQAQDGIAMTDADGRFVYVNSAHAVMFGFDRAEDLIGQRWSVLYEPAQVAEVERVAFSALARSGSWQGDAVGRARDGRQVFQAMSLTAMADGGVVCVTRDASERLKAEQERERLREQLVLAQRQEAVGRVASGVAHDFNNLLTAITGSAALLAQDMAPDDPGAQHARRILKAGDSAAALIARLLDAGKRKAQLRRVDLREPLREAADLIRTGLGPRVTLSVDLPDAPAFALTDPTAVLQVVLNLGINARDAVAEQGGCVRLSMELPDAPDVADEPDDGATRVGRLTPGRRHARITVSDDGPGLDEDAAGRIFEAWYSTKGAQGTGLGLAIVASLLTTAGGALTLDRAPEGGARFVVWWPLGEEEPQVEAAGALIEGAPPAAHCAPALADDDALEGVRPSPRASRRSLAGCAVLVAEDVPEVAQVIVAALESAGAEVAACENPLDALEAIQEDPDAWAVLVTDFDMPRMDGARLAQAAREASPDLPIVLCTALAAGRDAALFDEVAPKPVRPDRLLAAVLSALSAGQARRRLRETRP